VMFDIGSASVGVALATHKKDKGVVIHFTHREPIKFGSDQSASALGSYVAAAIKIAGTRAVDAAADASKFGNDYSVHAITHAPWASSRSLRADGVLSKEIKITREILQQFMAEHLPKTHTEGRVQFDRHVTRIELNEYATTEPYGKKANHIAMTVLESSMADTIYTAITNAFAEVFSDRETHMDAFLFAATQMNELFEKSDTYTIVDVGGEYTSVSVITNGTVTESVWASFGTEYLVRAVLDGADEGRQSAISELVMYIDNTCTPAQCRKLDSLLKKIEREWITAFGDACAKLSKTHRIPTKTFISIDKRFGPWFKQAVEHVDFGQFSVTGQPLKARLLTLEAANSRLTFKEPAKRDLMLSLGVLFVDK